MTAMKIEFRTRVGDAARARVADALKTALASLVVQPTIARATVTDENGPKGGRAMRCVVDVALPRRAPVHVEHTATTPRLALDGAVDVLERDLERLIKRRRDVARRPKKYYVAKRLLSA